LSKGTGRRETSDSKLLGQVLEQMPLGVLVLDGKTGRPLSWNARMAQAIGPIRARGMRSGPEWRGFHLEGTRVLPRDWPHEKVLRGETDSDTLDLRFEVADGSLRPLRLNATALRVESDLAGVMVTCEDRSEPREGWTSPEFLAEAGAVLASSIDYLTTLRNLARLAVPTLADWCTIDILGPDGRLERVAVEHVDQRKAEAAAELARRKPPDLESGRGVARVVLSARPVLITDVTSEALEEFVQGTGHRRVLEELGIRSLMVVPLIARERTIGAIGFVAAESGRRYTEADLAFAEALASRAALAIDNAQLFQASLAASEAKADFLAVMSHELRTPLTAIIGYAELLQLGVPEPVTVVQREQAERIEVSARQLLQMIEEILTLVTLDAGRARVRPTEISADEVLDRALEIVEPMARAKRLPLVVVRAPAPPVLRTDPDMVLQILLNLLSNAVKFTDRGEIGIRTSVEEGMLVFEVRDTGIGLEPVHLQRIFEPFWQVERPITRKAGGTGLGLTITRRLVELLGGEITLESAAGVGSTFRLKIPIGAVEAVDQSM